MKTTEKRTAEELAEQLRCTNGLMCEHHTDHAKRLFEQFAAQELDAYKARLKKHLEYGYASTRISYQEIIELIDML